MPKSQKSELNDFEKSLQQLEEIVGKMEQGQLSLEESLGAFEEGVKLTRTCQETLKNAEHRVSKLIQQGDEITTVPFENKPVDQEGNT